MLRIMSMIKIGLNDAGYFLLYEMEDLKIKQVTKEDARLLIFEEARKARFRFEKRSLYSESAATDLSMQYGNYHSAKIDFLEDFKELRYDEFFNNAEQFLKANLKFVNDWYSHEKAIKLFSANLQVVLPPQVSIFELDVEGAKTQAKIAPFATYDFFKSYLFFDGNEIQKFFYLELGQD